LLRFAISPTKEMNIGSLRLAILNHIISKRLDEDLIIRIDDLNQDLNIEDQDKEILEILGLFSIEYKYILNQSDNTKYHIQMAKQLNTTPSENFACAVDDMISNISTIIIDEKDISNTSTHIEIRNSLGYDKKINYISVPDITNASDIKILWLISEGYLPAAIANYLVELSYDIPKEIFTLEEAIQNFDINRISKKSVKFDINRLKLINKEYLKSLDNMRFSKLLGYADEDIGKLAKLYLDECDNLKQIKQKIDLIFDASLKTSLDEFEDELSRIKQCISEAPFIGNFNEFKDYITKQTKLDDEQLSMLLRLTITGSKNGPDLNKIYPLVRNYLGEII